MQRANPLVRNRKAVAARAPREPAGLIEVAILSLVGLAVAVMLIAQNTGPDALQLMMSQ